MPYTPSPPPTMPEINEPDRANRLRAQQKDIFPTAIKNRQFGQVIITSNLIATNFDLQASGAANKADQQVVTVKINSPSSTASLANSFKTMAVIDFTAFEGSVLTGSNSIPAGSNVNAANYQIIGPWTDWFQTDNKNSYFAYFIRNLSGGVKTIYIRGYVRFITQVDISGIT